MPATKKQKRFNQWTRTRPSKFEEFFKDVKTPPYVKLKPSLKNINSTWTCVLNVEIPGATSKILFDTVWKETWDGYELWQKLAWVHWVIQRCFDQNLRHTLYYKDQPAVDVWD